MGRARILLTGLGAAAVMHACPAAGQSSEPEIDYETERRELAGFPVIAGNSDTGLQLGAVGQLTQFRDGIRPYRWKLDALLSASFLSGEGGIKVAQHNDLVGFDLAGLAGGRLRSTTQVKLRRTLALLYYGIGNSSSAELPPVTRGDPAHYFESISTEVEARQLTRVRLRTPIDTMITTGYRYVVPDTYEGSKLEEDAPHIRGVRTLSMLTLGVGLIYDTRDNEFFTHSGMFHQVGPKLVLGFPTSADVRYLQASGFFAGYVPIGGPFVYAGRLVLDAQLGNVPYFDLYRAGPFEQYEMIGGSTGIRGVPVGRFLGQMKVLTNQELRAMLVPFHLFEQSFRFGCNVLFDIGRLWTDASFSPTADGKRIGLKWGAGGGLYLQWGQAAVFRLEVAYSPSAADVSPGLPIGVYINDGLSF
jgi:hypothetical protein